MQAINPDGKDTLLEEILALNDYSDASHVADIKHRLGWRNIFDKSNDPLFAAARSKGLM